VVTTLAGTPGSSGSSDGVGVGARFAYPAGIALSGDGATVLVADPDNQTLRRISFASVSPRVLLPLVRR
jgi:sugar lactone lactonase YvrE